MPLTFCLSLILCLSVSLCVRLYVLLCASLTPSSIDLQVPTAVAVASEDTGCCDDVADDEDDADEYTRRKGGAL